MRGNFKDIVLFWVDERFLEWGELAGWVFFLFVGSGAWVCDPCTEGSGVRSADPSSEGFRSAWLFLAGDGLWLAVLVLVDN